MISVTFPDSLETIELGAFDGCAFLQTLEIGENGLIQSINTNTFSGCENLTIIHLPSKGVLKEISISAFESCKNLEEITIPILFKNFVNHVSKTCVKLSNITFTIDESNLSN